MLCGRTRSAQSTVIKLFRVRPHQRTPETNISHNLWHHFPFCQKLHIVNHMASTDAPGDFKWTKLTEMLQYARYKQSQKLSFTWTNAEVRCCVLSVRVDPSRVWSVSGTSWLWNSLYISELLSPLHKQRTEIIRPKTSVCPQIQDWAFKGQGVL